jgi:uncharacterized protein YraI
MKERCSVQTPPLNARLTIGRVPRVLALVAFLIGTIVSSLTLAPARPAEAAYSVGTIVRTTTNLNLRSGPGTGYGVVLVMSSGSSFKITGSYNKGFYPGRYNGTKGWASADFLTTGGGSSSGSTSGSGSTPTSSDTGTATVTTSLNLRSGPSTGDGVIAVMPAGSTVTLTGQASNGFVSVTYQGMSGWAYQSYLGSGGSSGSGSNSGSGSTPSETGTAYTTTAVNLRSGASTSNSVITVVPSGAAVTLTGQSSNGFVSVSYNGSNGWLYASYVSSSNPGSGSGNGSGSGAGSGSGSGPGSDGVWSEQEIINLIYEAAAYYGQSGDDMLRVARCESLLNPSLIHPAYNASGLFQFLPSTWATTPYADQYILDPVANAYAAAWMWSVGRRNEWVCQ